MALQQSSSETDANDMNPVVSQVKQRIADEQLDKAAAAKEIGIPTTLLSHHLSGGYVRRTAADQYQAWLERSSPDNDPQKKLFNINDVARTPAKDPKRTRRTKKPQRPKRPYRVVDVFSGCGGLSLGFDLFGKGSFFQTVLAIDNEPSMVSAFNHNHPAQTGAGRRVDLSRFDCEAEILAYYLDHLSTIERNQKIPLALETLKDMKFSRFKSLVAAIDAQYLVALKQAKATDNFRVLHRKIKSEKAFEQTSVTGLQASLAFPLSTLSTEGGLLSGLPWWNQEVLPENSKIVPPKNKRYLSLQKAARKTAAQQWKHALEALGEKSAGQGKGQLTASAGKVAKFLKFLDSSPVRQLKNIWLNWRAERGGLRAYLFDNRATLQTLRTLYNEQGKVDVLLGGPPCQGFSRIGRGKLRSLRDNQLQVHVDDDAGDRRNQLLHKYVLFLSALAPRTFIFENVRHFQTEVKTPKGSFRATEVLAEAIENISNQHLHYDVSMETIKSQEHLIPQTRERFFMAGVRADADDLEPEQTVHSILALDKQEHFIPLKTVLDGSPIPVADNDSHQPATKTATSAAVNLSTSQQADGIHGEFLRWIRQSAPKSLKRDNTPDAHQFRQPRPDDEQFFDLMGPGKRWMDYRCDDSSTLQAIRELLATLEKAVGEINNQADSQTSAEKILMDQIDISELKKLADGSLSLRLLLEATDPPDGDEQNHLLAAGYMAKRDGNHGDWLSRLKMDEPSKTIVSHMAKDTYAYVHPYEPRTLSVREAARIQTFPDWFQFGDCGPFNGYRMVGNAVPPLLSWQLAAKVANALTTT